MVHDKAPYALVDKLTWLVVSVTVSKAGVVIDGGRKTKERKERKGKEGNAFMGV